VENLPFFIIMVIGGKRAAPHFEIKMNGSDMYNNLQNNQHVEQSACRTIRRHCKPRGLQ
jgi:hypothetical protein